MEATSAAKSSTFFSMPSPFSETNALYELDLAAQLLGNSLDVILERRPCSPFNESLLQEAVLLVVFADTAVYHLVDDLLRLRLSSGLVLLECLDEEDLLLLLRG